MSCDDPRWLLNRMILAAEYLLDGRPRQWVVRELNMPPSDVNDVARMLGFVGSEGITGWTLERYDAVEQAVADDWPLAEIIRTFKVDWTSVKRWFPDAGWGAGATKESEAVRKGNETIDQVLRERGLR